MRKALLLGAGFSKNFGLPITTDVTGIFKNTINSPKVLETWGKKRA